MATIIEVFIEQGNILESEINVNGTTTVLTELTVQEQTDITNFIGLAMTVDDTNCGWLIESMSTDLWVQLHLKHPSIDSDITICDKGGIINLENQPILYTPLDTLVTSILTTVLP